MQKPLHSKRRHSALTFRRVNATIFLNRRNATHVISVQTIARQAGDSQESCTCSWSHLHSSSPPGMRPILLPARYFKAPVAAFAPAQIILTPLIGKLAAADFAEHALCTTGSLT